MDQEANHHRTKSQNENVSVWHSREVEVLIRCLDPLRLCHHGYQTLSNPSDWVWITTQCMERKHQPESKLNIQTERLR